MTAWTRRHLDAAADLVATGRHHAALGHLLTVLDVHPGSAEARRAAARLLYVGPGGDVAEPVTVDDVRDTRLDPLFCRCDRPGCATVWISAGCFGSGPTIVRYPRGGHCGRCDVYTCREHFGPGRRCPACDGGLDLAPPVANGRPPLQAARLNRPLVHVLVLREGTLPPGTGFLDELLSSVSPDVFEDAPNVRGRAVPVWPADGRWEERARAALRHDDAGYLGDGYELRFAHGADRLGTRWGIVKVFAARPKHVDPDADPDDPDDPGATDDL